MTIEKSRKIESGSGSGDQEICTADDRTDNAAKKRKTRRGKPKYRKLKPYAKQQHHTYPQRTRCRSINRLIKKSTQPPAPYNTTQFLIADHNDLPDLKEKLAAEVTAKSELPRAFQKPLAPPRTRDSSFSVDSDEDYFYSSPEDEKEFLTKEFSSAYDDLQAERLSALSKYELIQEYIELEAKLEVVSKRLRSKNNQTTDERECDGKNTATASTIIDTDLDKKLKIFQQKIDDLMQQNEQLKRDNEALKSKEMRSPSPESSVDSESDSVSSNRSGCSCSGGSDSPAYKTGVNRRLSTASSSNDTTSSKNNPCISAPSSPAQITSDLVNGNTTNQGRAGFPT